jgi:hypothetical protein
LTDLNDNGWFDSGEVTDLGTLPGVGVTDAYASAINDVGQVAGASGGNAFIWQNGAMKKIGSLKDGFGPPSAINHAGQVVGGTNTAWVWTGNGKIQDLNSLIPTGTGWGLQEGRGINDAGRIVVVGSKPGFTVRACLLTPTTAPATTASTSTASRSDAKTPNVAAVDPLVLDDLAHWLSAGVQGKKTRVVGLR